VAPVGQQLRNVFGVKSVRLLETVTIRSRENRPAETNGILPSLARLEDATTFYAIRCRGVRVIPGESGPGRIRLDDLRFSAKVPLVLANNSVSYNDIGITTDVDVREGQKVVVGKSTIDKAAQSIFVVVTAKVVD
jgi:hypothetical protein